MIDSVLIRYTGSHGPDTAELHIRYSLGSSAHDTTIQLIGTLTSPLLGGPSRLHREAASAYYGQLDSLTLGVDLSSQINFDSLLPHITDIQATYSWDSSVASYASYLPPTGWLLSSISHGGNSVTFDIQNNSSSPSRPLDLGIALFRPRSTQLATSWVQLPDFVVDVSGHALSLCVTDNEDSHWSIKTLGELSGVVGASQSMQQNISIYPNPASGVAEISFINPTYAPVSYAVLDALGQTREQGEVFGNSLSLDVSRLVPGVYFIRATSGEGMSSLSQLVILR